MKNAKTPSDVAAIVADVHRHYGPPTDSAETSSTDKPTLEQLAREMQAAGGHPGKVAEVVARVHQFYGPQS
jgi:hypothetical protein